MSKKVIRTQLEGNADGTTERRDELIELFGEFERVNDEILKKVPADEGFDEVDAYFDKVEVAYVDTLKNSMDWLDNLNRDETTIQAQSEFTSMMNLISLPKLELKSFSGDPAEYHSFTKLFDISVASVTSSDDAKLTRLLQYTTGDAYTLIKRCILMVNGYQEARELLAERYGSNDIVCETMIEALLSTQNIRNCKELRRFSDLVSSTQTVLSSLDRLTEVNSQRFIRSVVEKLQPYARNKWKNRVADYKELNDAYPDFKYMCKFIHKISEAANDTYYGQIESTSQSLVSMTSLVTVTPTCFSCGGPHNLSICASFTEMDLRARLDTVRRNHLCRLCLMPGHFSYRCKSEVRCGTCGGDHATVVHCESAFTNSTVSHSSVCMPIVSVRVNGVRVNAVLDSASSASIITAGAMRQLGLRGRRADIQIETINGANVNKTTVVDFDIHADQDTRVSLTGVSVIDKIPVSTSQLCLDKYPHLKEINLFNKGVQNVDILIGQDNGDCLIPVDSRYGGRNEPYAVKYTIGWALGGRASVNQGNLRRVSNLIITHDGMRHETCEAHDRDDDGILPEELYPTSLWDEPTVLSDDNHSVREIPYKVSTCFVDNRLTAQQRRKSLDRFLKHKDIYDRGDYEMRKLIDSGCAEQEVHQRDERDKGSWCYLPHHGGVTDKQPHNPHVVFDSPVQDCCESLLDKHFDCSKQVNSLTGIILLLHYMLLTDIDRMYCQVVVPEVQQWYHLVRRGMNCENILHANTRVWQSVLCSLMECIMVDNIYDIPQASELVQNTVLKVLYISMIVSMMVLNPYVRLRMVDVTA